LSTDRFDGLASQEQAMTLDDGNDGDDGDDVDDDDDAVPVQGPPTCPV